MTMATNKPSNSVSSTETKKIEKNLSDENSISEKTDAAFKSLSDDLRKKIQELRRSKVQYRVLIEENVDGMILIDRTGTILYVNPAAEAIFDRKAEDLIGEVFGFPVVAGETSELEIASKRRMVVEMRVSETEWRGRSAYIASLRDISDRIRDEEKIKKSEEKYRALFEDSRDAIYAFSEDGKILEVNPAMSDLFGYDISTLISMDATDLYLYPEDRIKFVQEIEANTFVMDFESKMKKSNDEIMDCLITSSLIKSDNRENKLYQGIIRDVTERKRAERYLQKQHELVLKANKDLKKAFAKEEKLRSALTNAEKLASLGEMASKIAHEINNPLTVIKAQAEIRAQMVSDEALKESLLMIKEKADQIKILTRGYMNLAKPQEAELTKIRLRDVLRTTVRTLLPLGQLKHIKISEEYMKDEPSIFGDPGRLEQVFRNLLINAVDAMAEKSSSVIKIGTKLSKDKKSIDAYVKDNGVGIEAEDIEKIFEPYYTKKERAVGTGLGLVIVKETTENVHGGILKVESKLGEGTEFHVIIPIAERSSMKKKLLIVDDDLSICKLLAQYFTSKGLNVVKAENGKIALDIIKEFNPDLILSDIDMPYLDGIGLLEEVIKTRPELPFVMMTGFDSRASLRDELGNKGVTLILKPPDLEDELWPLIREKIGLV